MSTFTSSKKNNIIMKNIFKDLQRKDHKRYLGGLDVFRYIGPGLLVTVESVTTHSSE